MSITDKRRYDIESHESERSCDFPACPTKELVVSLKAIADRLSDLKVIENDIGYIREIIQNLDRRVTDDFNSLSDRMRTVEQDKIGRAELFSAVGATGVIVGVISFIIQVATK